MKSIKSVDKDGDIRYKNRKGDYHREDGPAYESKDGTKSWWINGKRHREDGPALVWASGGSSYFLNNKQFTKEDWEQEVLKLKLNRIKDL